MKTWENTIVEIRNKPEFTDLVYHSYLEEDLIRNTDRYFQSEEFNEIRQHLHLLGLQGKKVLDIGSGNGISVIAFARLGYEVHACEPDSSDTVGCGAIEYLIDKFSLGNKVVIHNCTAEQLDLSINFDLIFARQAMHHADDLDAFVKNTTKYLKKGGIFFTVRDHVLNSESLLQDFLERHPLHRYYGGEYAYSKKRYTQALTGAGLSKIRCIEYDESIINFAPKSPQEMEERKNKITKRIRQKIGFNTPLVNFLATKFIKRLKQSRYPNGRPISFIAIK